MADKNICNVELLNSMSENTNVIVDENGVLNKLNLYNEISAINDKISDITNNGVTVGDTLPLESQFYWDKDEEIPAGYVEVTPPFANENLFINGDFAIWQRGESITVADSRKYTADRWGVFFKSTVSRNVDGAGMKIVAQAGDYGSVNQYVEFSYETIGLLINKPMTLTVRLRTNRPLNAGIGLIGDDKAITTSTVWNDYTHTFIPKSTDFIWVQDTNSYLLRVNIFAYGSGNLFQDGDTIEIRFAKLEQGSIATPFSPRPYAEEYAMCQRYYQTLGENTAIIKRADIVHTSIHIDIILDCKMRATPTVVDSYIQAVTLDNMNWLASGGFTALNNQVMRAYGNIDQDCLLHIKDVRLDAEIY